MKKSLLIAVAALFVALGANAQVKRIAKFPKANAQEMKQSRQVVSKAVKVQDLQKLTTATLPTSSSKGNQARRGAADFAGDYIMNSSSWPGEEPLFTYSLSFTIQDQSGTIELDGDLFDESENIPFKYNVILQDFPLAGYPVYGYFDEADNTITIPVQTIFSYGDYGRIVFSACVQDGNGDPFDYGWPMVLNLNSDGSVEIDEGDFSEMIDEGEYPDDEYYIGGFWNFMPDYLNTKGYPSLWNYGFDSEIFVPNATLYFATTGRNWGSNGSSWLDVTIPAYVDDYGSEWVISNFIGLTTCSVTINGDGTCSIPFGQLMDDYDYSEYDSSYDYGYMRIVGCKYLEGNSIGRDYDKTALKGFNDATEADFFKVVYRDAWTDSTGAEHEAGYYIDYDDEEYNPYFAVATYAGPEGAYHMGWFYDLWVELNNGDTDGIQSLKVVPGTQSTTLYDLQGRVVDGSYKGVVISNGKKVVVK